MNAKGFTLIELMVVVAVIGVLAVIMVPIYQTYVVRSQLTTALGELNGARIQYELVVNDGAIGTTFTVDNMNLSEKSHFCIYKVYEPVLGVSNPALECELKNVSAAIEGEKIFLTRQADGLWKCEASSGIANKYRPVDCI